MSQPKFELTSLQRHAIILALCVIGGLIAVHNMGLIGWTQSWIGAMFRAASGGALGFAVSRFALRLDLSQIHDDWRALAALSQAILIAGFAVAVAVGV